MPVRRRRVAPRGVRPGKANPLGLTTLRERGPTIGHLSSRGEILGSRLPPSQTLGVREGGSFRADPGRRECKALILKGPRCWAWLRAASWRRAGCPFRTPRVCAKERVQLQRTMFASWTTPLVQPVGGLGLGLPLGGARWALASGRDSRIWVILRRPVVPARRRRGAPRGVRPGKAYLWRVTSLLQREVGASWTLLLIPTSIGRGGRRAFLLKGARAKGSSSTTVESYLLWRSRGGIPRTLRSR